MTTSPIMVILGIVLIIGGLLYPFLVLWQLNRRLSGKDAEIDRSLIVTLVLAGLAPLMAALAGLWLIFPQARGSLVFTGAMLASAVLLVATLIAGWYINRKK